MKGRFVLGKIDDMKMVDKVLDWICIKMLVKVKCYFNENVFLCFCLLFKLLIWNRIIGNNFFIVRYKMYENVFEC